MGDFDVGFLNLMYVYRIWYKNDNCEIDTVEEIIYSNPTMFPDIVTRMIDNVNSNSQDFIKINILLEGHIIYAADVKSKYSFYS
ncbi:MAG: hypothetical protein Q4P17_03910 [Methanobacterium sp.]|nr:hypothetical protein [Methanobacterium sp.]